MNQAFALMGIEKTVPILDGTDMLILMGVALLLGVVFAMFEFDIFNSLSNWWQYR